LKTKAQTLCLYQCVELDRVYSVLLCNMESQLVDQNDAMEVSGDVDLSTYEVQVDQETYEGMLL